MRDFFRGRTAQIRNEREGLAAFRGKFSAQDGAWGRRKDGVNRGDSEQIVSSPILITGGRPDDRGFYRWCVL
jgi:hypothetical protein